MEYLDQLLNYDDILDQEKKYQIKTDLYTSIVSQWILPNLDNSVIKKNIFIQQKINPNPLNFKSWISNSINKSNKLNEYVPDDDYNNDFYDVLEELYKFGVIFDIKSEPDNIIQINPNSIVFPICCVGKNRSQYMFYYLKNLQALNSNSNSDELFEVGYPSSADELSVITRYLQSTETKLSNFILSSYSTPYKKDAFSSSISNSFGLTNPDGLTEIPRSVHIFDKVLKYNSPFTSSDIKNYELYKYKTNIYDIFEPKNNLYTKIIVLYIKYFLNPKNLIKMYEINLTKKTNKITYICLSDKSFYNFCLCIREIKKSHPEINLSFIRIVYFGIQDIFQRTSIKNDVLTKYKEKFVNAFQYVLN